MVREEKKICNFFQVMGENVPYSVTGPVYTDLVHNDIG